MRHASTSPPGWIVSSPIKWLCSSVASSLSAASGRAGARSSISRPSGRTRIFSGALCDAGAVSCAMRPSVAAIAGWPLG